jgi:hypothetical protein
VSDYDGSDLTRTVVALCLLVLVLFLVGALLGALA